MATNLLWFVMAGFLLGFATSTLWEWFYFRKERLKLTDRRIRELESKLRDVEAEAESIASTPSEKNSQVPTVAAVTREQTRTTAWGDPAYRSPGVFLESEDVDAEDVRGARRHDDEDDEYDGEYGEGYGDEFDDEMYGPASVVPTVDSVSGRRNPDQASASVGSQRLKPAQFEAPKASSSTASSSSMEERAIRSQEKAGEQPTPADMLRAKRSGRSRQELLAALRRNSEAVQRGEYPPPPSTRVGEGVEPFDEEDAEDGLADDVAQGDESPAVQEPALPPGRAAWVNDVSLTARSKEYPDDLSKIRGIGDVYKQRLYRAGIYTWKQITETETEVLRRATSAYPSSNVEEWLSQAEALMAKHGRQQAVYSGPAPDEMTKILGIGPVSAAALYRAGICTYEQLASTPVADLEALFPIAVAGDVPDFADWIARATKLADEKHLA